MTTLRHDVQDSDHERAQPFAVPVNGWARVDEGLAGLARTPRQKRGVLTGPAGLEPATPGFGDRCSTT